MLCGGVPVKILGALAFPKDVIEKPKIYKNLIFLKQKSLLWAPSKFTLYHLSMFRSWFFFLFFTKIHLKETYFHWLRVHNRNIVLNKLISVASSAMIQSVGPPLVIGLSTGTTPLSTAVHHCLEPQHLKISSEYSLSQCISQKFSLRYHGPF